MLVDYRYHVGSIVAIFFALGIGILIGHGLLGKEGLLEEQQRLLVGELETRFERLQEEREKLDTQLTKINQELAREREFAKSALPLAVGSRLVGKDIMIIITGQGMERNQVFSLTKTLEDAGAGVGIMQVTSQEQDVAEKLAKVLDDPVEIKELAKSGDINIWQELEYEIDGVILLGGSVKELEIDPVDIFFLQAWSGMVIGTEFSQTTHSYMKIYQDQGIATVDNIDTPAGQLGLVLLLAEDPGFNDTARSLLPKRGR